MSEELESWIEQARAYLNYQVDQGIREVILPQVREEERAAGIVGRTEATEARSLEAVREELGDCVRCPLHKGRRNIVFGEGNPEARLLFVGEGPGADEDRQGRPFVGRAGQLLTRMIAAMGLDRGEVYIANIVKCRPPQNRDPRPDEIETCFPFLEAQIATIRPEVIVALGRVAAQTLLETDKSLTRLRGRFHERNGIPVMTTYHPSFLLRKEGDRRWKGQAWSDLKQVMSLLGLPE